MVGDSTLTDEDLDSISALALHMEGSGLLQTIYSNLQKFFSNKLKLDTEYLMYHQMEMLSGVLPAIYDMCSGSCCLFVGPFADHMKCAICQNLQFHPDGKPITHFSYLPLIPHLKPWFQSLSTINHLRYQSQYIPMEGETNVIFDGNHYQRLLRCWMERNWDINSSQMREMLPWVDPTDGFQVC